MFFVLFYIHGPLRHFVKHPTTIQVSGTIRCIKTRLVRKILDKQLIQPFATRIIWLYREWQLDYDIIRERYPCIKLKKVWRNDIFDSLTLEQRNILVLDDQINVTSLSKSMSNFFTNESHHKGLIVIYLVPNL